MLRVVLLVLLLAACEGTAETCPHAAPATLTGEGYMPVSVPAHPSPPLKCGYFDSCGEVACIDRGEGWTCCRADVNGLCSDAATPGGCKADGAAVQGAP